MNQFQRNLALWVIIGLFAAAIYNIFQSSNNEGANNLSYSEFMRSVQDGTVKEVEIEDVNNVNVLTGRMTSGHTFITYAPRNSSMIEKLEEKGVDIKARAPEKFSFWSLLLNWMPMLILVGIWLFALRQMQGGGGKIMGFGRSRARMLTEKQGHVTFDDVAGIDEAKNELEEIVDFLKDPKKFQRLGGQIPRGVLLVGPPGTGKTLLARSIAGEANVPFFTISGSDFVEMFVGVGASRVRDMFEQAKKSAPCIIFIDEIDAVGRHRGAGLGGGNDEREQTLNQLLVEMDGFEGNEGIIIIAATNRPDVLDPALLRPGRFDRQVVVPVPDLLGREKILGVHVRKVPLASDVNLHVIARGTPGFSGADLKNLVNEAALLAARRNKRSVMMTEFEEAKDKVMMGAERKSMVMGEEEKKLTAYHEAGHALVALNMEDSDPIHKATIIPRGQALGMVMRLPERDRHSVTRAKLKADLAVAMGGRVAEEIIFGEAKITTGASSDIKMATNMARRMVTEWGMSPEIGPLSYSEGDQEVFLGYSMGQRKHMGDATAETIDREIRIIVEEAYAKAKEILNKYADDLHILAKGLLEHETLSGDELKGLLVGIKVERPVIVQVSSSGRASSVPSSSTGPKRRKKPKVDPSPT